MILVIDNYDSFTYNLVQYIGTIISNINVVRNNRFDIDDIQKWQPTHIVITPGPGKPENAGYSINVIKKYGSSIPILGVCLGHQCITAAYGGSVVQSLEIVHGKTSKIKHNHSFLYQGIENYFTATRYHSLIAERSSLPADLCITSEADNGIIMGIEHKYHPVFGVQFHPESIATNNGMKIIKNFLMI